MTPRTPSGIHLAAQRVPPSTVAGRRLLALYDDAYVPSWETFGEAVAAIEQEAVAVREAELRRIVEQIPSGTGRIERDGDYTITLGSVEEFRAAVLALLTPSEGRP